MEKQRRLFSLAQSLGISGESPSLSHTLRLFPVSSRSDHLPPSLHNSFSLSVESSRPTKSPTEKASLSPRVAPPSLPPAFAPGRSAPRCSQHRCRSPAEAVAAPQGSCCCCCSGETQGASPSFVLLLQRRRRLLAIKLSPIPPSLSFQFCCST